MNFGEHLSGERGTRERVLRAVSEHGPITAATLAQLLGLTPAGIRRHLDGLTEEHLIEERDHGIATRKRGRPARAYVLSDAGHQRLKGDYDELAGEVLRYLRDNIGEQAVESFARDRAAQLARRLEPALAGARDARERSEALAAALTDEGYAASARPVGEGTSLAGVQLCQGHCPVQHVASEFPAFCETEREEFSRLLGVHVQRLASLAHGDHVCTTFIPLAPHNMPAPSVPAHAAVSILTSTPTSATERDPR